MAFIGLLGFIFLCIMVAYKFNEKLIKVLPLCIGIWTFILYILAFFKKLCWIDYIGGAVFLLILFWIISKREEFIKKKSLFLCNSTFVLFIVYLLLWFINKERVAWKGDDLGVWAIEVKSIFFVNGFADKYKNVSLGYGDYHPAQMLFEWWICHFDSRKFNEGLMYVGYSFLYASFLMPVLEILDKRKNKVLILDGFIIFVLIILLPSCVDILSYYILSVELLISVIYANLLYIALEDVQNNGFYYLKITVYLFLILLLKNTGIVYVVLFWILFFVLKCKEKKIAYINRKKIMFIALGSMVPVIIWKIYCHIWDRTNYFTTIGENLLKDMVNKTFQFSSNTNPLIISFFQSLVVEPLHLDKTIFLDIPVILCVILTVCLLCFAVKKDKNSVSRNVIVGHYLISVVVLLTGLLFIHVFVFQESQYIETGKMIYSISRYVEPIFLGTIIFAFMIIIDRCSNSERRWNILLGGVIIPILFCANYGALYRLIIDYLPIREFALAERAEISNKNIKLIEEVENRKISGRVLYVVNNDKYFDPMAQRRLSYLISPVSIVYRFVDISVVDREQNYSDILWMINNSNCQYVFFNGIPDEYLGLFQFSNKDYKENVLLEIEKDINQNIYFKPID